MKYINNYDLVVDWDKNWKYSDLAFIKKIIVYNNEILIEFLSQTKQPNCPIWPDYEKNFNTIVIKFFNAVGIKLNFENAYFQQVYGFDIIDLVDSQLENIKFKIEDYENGVIEFYCQAIEFVSISNPIKLDINELGF